MRLTDFWKRLEHVFGPAYARSVAHDQVLSTLNGRTIEEALAAFSTSALRVASKTSKTSRLRLRSASTTGWMP